MRLVALFSIATLVALVIQTSVLRWLPVGQLVPDLVLILAVNLGMRHHRALSPLLAFAMGYATDAFSGTQIGLNAFMVTLVFLLAYELSVHVFVGSPSVGPLVVFLGVIAKSLGGFALGWGYAAFSEVHELLPWILLQAALTAVLAPPFLALLAATERVLGLQQAPRRARRELMARGG